MNDVFILGGAQTDFERNWNKEGKNMLALIREVLDDGLQESGVSYEEIEKLNQNNRIGMFVGNFIGEKFCKQGHLGAFPASVNAHLNGIPCARYEAACASSSVALDAAISKIRSGEYDLCIIIGWELMKTVDSKTCGDILGYAAFYEEEAKGIERPFPNLFGKLADAMINKYELDEDRFMNSLATIASINYKNAKRNPNAQTRKWFMDDLQARMRGTSTNPYVGGRLAVSDCSQITDGAALITLASSNYLKDHNLNATDFPKVLGSGHRNATIFFEDKLKESVFDEYILPWTRRTIMEAYRQANLTVEDVDVFEIHDCFTSSEYMAISAFGICEPGKEYEVIENGEISFNGKYPINPSGGLIGCGHPVGASGVRMFLDLYKQVSGKAYGYQINGAKIGAMLNIGGTATTNYSFIIGFDK